MAEAAAALIPSVGVGLLFWYVVRALVRGDRNERAALAALDAAERRRASAEADANGKPAPSAD